MPRLKIELPEKLLTTVSVPVRINDINYGNHVGNNAIVEIIHESRAQFLNQHGLTEMDVVGYSLIMSELSVVFKNESFYKDVAYIKIYCGEITRVSFELFYEISVERNKETIIIALAKTGMVCYDYKIKKVETIPELLKNILVG